MRRIYLIFILLAILFIAGCSSQTTKTRDNTQTTGDTVRITADGFVPNELRIKVGDTITWINEDTKDSWPASAIHPTHAVYPEPGGCIGSMFDACKRLKQGESWSFTFNQKGTWGYHDHVNFPGRTGKIIVE